MFQGVVYIYTVVQCTPTEKERKLFSWSMAKRCIFMMNKKNLSWKYFDEILSQLVVKQSEWKNIYFLRENGQTTDKSTTYAHFAHSYYHFCERTHLKVGIVFNSWHLFSMFWVHLYHPFQKFNLLWFLTNILTHNNRFSWILKPLKKNLRYLFSFSSYREKIGYG